MKLLTNKNKTERLLVSFASCANELSLARLGRHQKEKEEKHKLLLGAPSYAYAQKFFCFFGTQDRKRKKNP